MAGLTDMQRVFVESYLRCWIGSDAAREAGYKNPGQMAYQLLQNTSIQEAIQARITEMAMSADEVLIRLADHARGSLDDVTSFVTERRPTRMQKPLADIIRDLQEEMAFEQEYAEQADLEGPERTDHDKRMAALERRILRYKLRLERDPDATDEVAGPMVEELVPVVDLVKAKKLGKMHLLKSYNAKDNKVELYDAQAALQLLGKHHGLFKDVLDIHFDPTKLTDDQIDRIEAGEDPRKVLAGG